MKVLLINEVCGTGSTGRICTDIASALEARGHEARIAYGRDGSVPEQFRKYAVRIGTDADVRLHALKARCLDAAGFGGGAATRRFLAWAERYDPDVIHLHNLHGYYVNIERLFAYLKSCGKRVIWTLHDCWAFTGHSAYCDAARCEKWRSGCGRCPQVLVYPRAYLDRSVANWRKKRALFTGVPGMEIVTPSDWLAGLVKQSFLGEYPVQVIHNGVDTGIFSPLDGGFREAHGLMDKTVLLGAAAVWSDMKGYGDFIRLAKRLDGGCRLVMVGGMTSRQRRELPENVIYIQRTQSAEEMARIYSAADAFLNLTYCDTYPTVNLEAAACGTPVITYDTGGSGESALRYGGITVDRGDIDRITALLADAKSRKRRFRRPDPSPLDRRTSVGAYIEKYTGAPPEARGGRG